MIWKETLKGWWGKIKSFLLICLLFQILFVGQNCHNGVRKVKKQSVFNCSQFRHDTMWLGYRMWLLFSVHDLGWLHDRELNQFSIIDDIYVFLQITESPRKNVFLRQKIFIAHVVGILIVLLQPTGSFNIRVTLWVASCFINWICHIPMSNVYKPMHTRNYVYAITWLRRAWMLAQYWATCCCRRPSVGQSISAAVNHQSHTFVCP